MEIVETSENEPLRAKFKRRTRGDKGTIQEEKEEHKEREREKQKERERRFNHKKPRLDVDD